MKMEAGSVYDGMWRGSSRCVYSAKRRRAARLLRSPAAIAVRPLLCAVLNVKRRQLRLLPTCGSGAAELGTARLGTGPGARRPALEIHLAMSAAHRPAPLGPQPRANYLHSREDSPRDAGPGSFPSKLRL